MLPQFFNTMTNKLKTFLLIFLSGWLLSGCAPQPLKLSENHIQINQPEPPGEIPPPVLNLPPLFSSSPAIPEERELYTIVVNDVDLKELLFAVARDADINIDIASDISGAVTLNAIDQTLSQILERIAVQNDLRYNTENGVLVIRKDAPYFVHYNISYVNLNRTSSSNISISTQIATTGVGANDSNNASGNVGGNDSSTTITTESSNRFWATMVQNIDALLNGGNSVQSALGGNNTLQSNGESSTQTPQPTRQSNTDVSIIANPESGTLTIKATQKQHQVVQRFIDEVLTGAQRQVLIEATIVEVKLNDDFQAGVDWQRLISSASSGLNVNQTLTGTNLTTAPAFTLGYTDPNGKHNLSTTVKLLNEFGNTKVLSTPKLMVLNNQTALIKVVDNRIYFTIDVEEDIEDGLVNRTFTSEVHTVPVGLVMGVTPQISPDNNITLNIRPTISRILQFVEDPNPALAASSVKNLIPEISVREMESIMRLHDGEIAIIGGLMQDNHRDSTAGVPQASKLPLIGNLFSYRNNKYSKSELVIFIRPIIVNQASLNGDLKKYKKLLPISIEQARKAL